MIFIDSNVPMYLVGADHPNKPRSRELLERMIVGRERLVTSAEVFQEILHRYTSIDRRDAIRPAWTSLQGIVDEVFPVELEDVGVAMDMVMDDSGVTARGALHVATMRRHAVDQILSFDRGLDHFSDISRIE